MQGLLWKRLLCLLMTTLSIQLFWDTLELKFDMFFRFPSFPSCVRADRYNIFKSGLTKFYHWLQLQQPHMNEQNLNYDQSPTVLQHDKAKKAMPLLVFVQTD